jgi:hypothetical protein
MIEPYVPTQETIDACVMAGYPAPTPERMAAMKAWYAGQGRVPVDMQAAILAWVSSPRVRGFSRKPVQGDGDPTRAARVDAWVQAAEGRAR